MKWLLVAVLVVPLLAAIAVWLAPERIARWLAVGGAGLTFVLAAGLLAGREAAIEVIDPWYELDVSWVPALGVRFHLGVDGLSYPLIVLTALLVLCCAISIGNFRGIIPLLFVLEAAMIGVFLALDLVLFFIFFELTLLPMYAVIAGWGGAQRIRAARKFVLYTLTGSALLLIGVVWLSTASNSTDLVQLANLAGDQLSRNTALGLFIVLLVAFAIKSPLWPLHTWLPDAHTEAPTVGSVLLAGVLLKLGTYGVIRVAVTTLPAAAQRSATVIGVLAVAAIIIGALICLALPELKRLIAYSSVGHMGFVLLGVATLTEAGLSAAMLANIAHGLITGLLFFLVAAVKERCGTGELTKLGGLRWRAPQLAGLLGFTAAASFGLPGLAGFWGEAFSIAGAWQAADGQDGATESTTGGAVWRVLAVLAALGAALVVAYFLRMLRQVVAEPAPLPSATKLAPVTGLEIATWTPLLVSILVLGLWPNAVLDLVADPVRELVHSIAGAAR